MTTNSKVTPKYGFYTVTLERPLGFVVCTPRSEVVGGSSRRVITGYRGPRQLGSVNSCVHTSTSWVANPIDCHTAYPYGSGYVVHGQGTYELHAVASAMPSCSSEAIDKALSYLRGEIPTDVLLPAFVIELPQAIGLVGQLKKAISVVRGPNLRSFAREIASGHLAYAFGIAPLISDLRKLRSLTNSIRKKVAYLSDFSTVDFRPVKVGISMASDADFTCENTQVPCEAYDAPTWKKSVFNHASVFGRCRRTRQLVAADTRAAYLDALGIGKIGSTIWEEIPFSFIADWIYRCGDILEGLDHSFFKGCLEVTHVGFQSKVVGVAECWVRPLTYVAPLPVINIGTLYASVYNRSNNIPSTSNWGDPGVRQITLSGSLILQKVLG